MTTKLTFNIDLVQHGFIPLFENVELLFPEDSQTAPQPKDATVWHALQIQRPDLVAKIPMWDENHRCGLCYTVVKREHIS